MKPIHFQTADWNSIPGREEKGVSGTALSRTMQFDNFRVRMIEYSKDYRANHWCSAGHIVYCVEGELVSEHADGRKFHLREGMSYVVSDDVSQHRSYSETGVKLIIIDGEFLKMKSQVTNPWKM